MTESESELNRIVIETIRRAQAGERLVPQELAALEVVVKVCAADRGELRQRVWCTSREPAGRGRSDPAPPRRGPCNGTSRSGITPASGQGRRIRCWS